jgi:hypothetical protein
VSRCASAHREALSKAVRAVDDPAVLPSARAVREMVQDYDGSHGGFAIARSVEHRRLL